MKYKGYLVITISQEYGAHRNTRLSYRMDKNPISGQPSVFVPSLFLLPGQS